MMMNLSRTALFSMALAAAPVVAHAFDLDSRDLREGETIRMELVNSTMGCVGLNQSPHLLCVPAGGSFQTRCGDWLSPSHPMVEFTNSMRIVSPSRRSRLSRSNA